MQKFLQSIHRVPRYVRFIIIAATAILINLLLAVVLLWLIYPEWSRKTKMIITIIAVLVFVYQVTQFSGGIYSFP